MEAATDEVSQDSVDDLALGAGGISRRALWRHMRQISSSRS